MIGKIIFDEESKCQNCPLANLRIDTLYSDNRAILHTVVCEHEAACNRIEYICTLQMEDRVWPSEEDQNKNEKEM